MLHTRFKSKYFCVYLRRNICGNLRESLLEHSRENLFQKSTSSKARNCRSFIPLLVGVLPLYSIRHVAFLHNEVPGISIPEEYQIRMQDSGEQATQEGVKIALELIATMREFANGIYLMPQFGRCDLAAEIIVGCQKAG